MVNYKELYFKLFRVHNKVIEMLVAVGQEAEEIYINNDDPIHFPAQDETEGGPDET